VKIAIVAPIDIWTVKRLWRCLMTREIVDVEDDLAIVILDVIPADIRVL
jgi:hypothetical protein